MSVIEKVPYSITDTSLAVLTKDPLANPGSQFIFRLSNPACLDPGAALVNGLAINNLVVGGPAASILLGTAGDLALPVGAGGLARGIQKLNGNNSSGIQLDSGTQYLQANLGHDFILTNWTIQPFGATTLAVLYAADVAAPYTKFACALVYNDAGTPANNGIWRKTGATAGAGNWTQLDTSVASTGNWTVNKLTSNALSGLGLHVSLSNGYSTPGRIDSKFSDDTVTSNYTNGGATAAGARGGLLQLSLVRIGLTLYVYIGTTLIGSGAITTPLTAHNAKMYFGILPTAAFTAISGLIMCGAMLEDLTISAAIAGVSTTQQAINQIALDNTYVNSNNLFVV